MATSSSTLQIGISINPNDWLPYDPQMDRMLRAGDMLYAAPLVASLDAIGLVGVVVEVRAHCVYFDQGDDIVTSVGIDEVQEWLAGDKL